MRRKRHRPNIFGTPIAIRVKNMDVAGLHWAISISITTYSRWEFFLDSLAYMARSSSEKKVAWTGYHACPTSYREWHLWGKIPWQQFKNHPWWFRPLLVIRRHR